MCVCVYKYIYACMCVCMCVCASVYKDIYGNRGVAYGGLQSTVKNLLGHQSLTFAQFSYLSQGSGLPRRAL